MRRTLLAPKDTFPEALAVAERSRGAAPLVFAAAGGASLMLLWLKVAGAAGWREVCDVARLPGYVAASLLLGAVLGLGAMMVWSLVARPLAPARTRPAPGLLRFAWGTSAFPHVAILVLFLPLDALFVGSAAFTTERLSTAATAWSTVSLTAAAAAAAWQLWLLTRGFEAAGRTSFARAGAATAVAVLCLAGLSAAFVLAASGAGAGGCA